MKELDVLKLPTLTIGIVVLVEEIIGIYAGSLALIADALHAVIDVIACIAVLVVAKLSLKPLDEMHSYGHRNSIRLAVSLEAYSSL